MPQLVFIHGPGAGGCAEAFRCQLDHFRGSIAPTLPGHLTGVSCASIERYTDWLRGWLWAQGHDRDLVLVGFTLGSCIALQYALDYPEEVQGLVLMTVSMRPKRRAPDTLNFRLRAAADPTIYEQWIDAMREAMQWVAPALRERLIACHRQVGPRCVADEERVTGEHEPRLVAARPVDHRKCAMLGPMPGCAHSSYDDASELDLRSILQRVVREARLRRLVDPDRQSVLEGEPAVAGDVIGVGVRLEYADKLDLVLRRRVQILLDGESGIDDDRLPRLLVADEIRGAPEIVVDELSKEHGRDRSTRCGYIS